MSVSMKHGNRASSHQWFPYCNDKENSEFHHEYNNKRKKQTMISPKPRKKYGDMRKHHIKVTYNSMGEAVKKKINLDRKRSLKRRRKNVHNDVRDKGVPQCQLERNVNKQQFVVKRRETSYSLSDLTKTIHVLREVLLGKLSRDIMYSRSLEECTLPEMLRFYCETSFGATTIADCRQTDLYNAILALQRVSPFLRTMKRLLNIPGIKAYSKEITQIYFELWTWIMTNDVIVDYEFQLESQAFIAIDDDAKLKRLLVTVDSFLDCLNWIIEEYDHLFSQNFVEQLKQRIELLESFNLDDNEKGWEKLYDVDDILELTLNILEDYDEDVDLIDKELFGTSVKRNKLMTPSNSVAVNFLHDDSSFYNSLKRIKALLNAFIVEDENRDGRVQYMHFRQLLQAWFIASGDNDFFDQNQFKMVFELFESDDDAVSTSNYVYFVGVVYTILIDEQTIPNLKDVSQYLNECNRGIDARHFELLNDYVAKVRLKKTMGFCSTGIEVDIEHVPVTNESRRTISRSKMTTHDSTSDFLAKWLTAGPMRNEFRTSIKESLEAANEMNRRSPLKKEREVRPKTPLHLVEPQGDFDPEVMDIFDLIEVENATLNSLGSFNAFSDEDFGPQFLESQAKVNKGSREQDPAQHDEITKPINYASILFEFEKQIPLETGQERNEDFVINEKISEDKTNMRRLPCLRPLSRGGKQNLISKDEQQSNNNEAAGLLESRKNGEAATSRMEDEIPQSRNSSKVKLTDTLIENIVEDINCSQSVNVDYNQGQSDSTGDLILEVFRDTGHIATSVKRIQSSHVVHPLMSCDFVSSMKTSDVDDMFISNKSHKGKEVTHFNENEAKNTHVPSRISPYSSIVLAERQYGVNHSMSSDFIISKDPSSCSKAKYLNGDNIQIIQPILSHPSLPYIRYQPLVLSLKRQLSLISIILATKAAKSSWTNLIGLERMKHLQNNHNISEQYTQVPCLLGAHGDSVRCNNLVSILLSGVFSRHLCKGKTIMNYQLRKSALPTDVNRSKTNSLAELMKPYKMMSTSIWQSTGRNLEGTMSTYSFGSDLDAIVEVTINDDIHELDHIHLWLTDRRQWEVLFEQNESLLLGIICKFHSHHQHLNHARNRHRIDADELQNIAACIATLRRMNRNRQLEHSIVTNLRKSPQRKCVDLDGLGVGIKSLLLTAKKRKATSKRNISTQPKLPTMSKSYVYGQKIQIIYYRLAK